MDQFSPPGAADGLAADIAARTDAYFNRTRAVVQRFGDKRVTYAVFLRRPVISAPRLMLDWLAVVAEARNTRFDIDVTHPEGTWVGAGEPLAYITGSFVDLSDLETILLQKLGAACVAAHNAYQMCLALPNVDFLAMEARHCAGAEMQEMMAYAAAVGSAAARREGARGFVGNANDGTAHWFGNAAGRGTMPHALIGYAGSTVRAAEMFRETFPDETLTVLVDYFGREVTDAARGVPTRFPDIAAAGRLVGPPRHARRALPGRARPGRKLRRAGAPRAGRHPPLPQRHRAALPRRHRRLGRGGLAHARGTRPTPASPRSGSSARPASASRNAA